MIFRRVLSTLALLATIPLALGQSCAFTVPTTDTNDVSDSLTAAEADAVQAAIASSGHLAQATITSQNASSTGDDSAAQSVPDLSEGITFGTCPEVTLDATGDGSLNFSVAIDFGDGCEPAVTDGYVCSGSASGSVSQTDKNIELTFENVGCNDDTLTGTASLTYDRNPPEISLTGNWDLTAVRQDDVFATDGTGTCAYDTSEYVTTIDTFDGTIAVNDENLSLTADAVRISYPNTGSPIPFSGEVTVSGTSVRTVTVRFDEDSPSTGEIDVSIDGSPFFTVNLSDL